MHKKIAGKNNNSISREHLKHDINMANAAKEVGIH